MVNVSTQLSAKMEAPYGEYSVPIARAASLASLAGALPCSAPCKGWTWRQEKGSA